MARLFNLAIFSYITGYIRVMFTTVPNEFIYNCQFAKYVLE